MAQGKFGCLEFKVKPASCQGSSASFLAVARWGLQPRYLLGLGAGFLNLSTIDIFGLDNLVDSSFQHLQVMPALLAFVH